MKKKKPKVLLVKRLPEKPPRYPRDSWQSKLLEPDKVQEIDLNNEVYNDDRQP